MMRTATGDAWAGKTLAELRTPVFAAAVGATAAAIAASGKGGAAKLVDDSAVTGVTHGLGLELAPVTAVLGGIIGAWYWRACMCVRVAAGGRAGWGPQRDADVCARPCRQ